MENVATLNYVVSTRAGHEHSVAERIKKAARRCKEIVSVIPFFPGYVRVEVVAGENAEIKSASFDMPKGTKMVINMVPGVIEVVGNGKEAIPL
jgi:transcription antitermination factor NusG